MRSVMKFIITGIIGLLMITINLIGFFSRDNTVVNASYLSAQMTDENKISQTGCNQDCAACGKCFSGQSANITQEISDMDITAKVPLNIN
jgi:hypothetical protein